MGSNLTHDGLYYEILQNVTIPETKYDLGFMNDYARDHPDTHIDYVYNKRVVPNSFLPDNIQALIK